MFDAVVGCLCSNGVCFEALAVSIRERQEKKTRKKEQENKTRERKRPISVPVRVVTRDLVASTSTISLCHFEYFATMPSRLY
jgi:hypothetical protein